MKSNHFIFLAFLLFLGYKKIPSFENHLDNLFSGKVDKQKIYEKYIKDHISQLSFVKKATINKLTCQKTNLKDHELDVCIYHVHLQQNAGLQILDTFYCFSFTSISNQPVSNQFSYQPYFEKCPAKMDTEDAITIIRNMEKYDSQ